MNHLSEQNRQLLSELGTDAGAGQAAEEVPELERLRTENAELRQAVAELEERLAAAGNTNWADKEKEYDSLLEEKSEVIRGLHVKIKELQEQAPKAGRPLPDEEELQKVCDELERERAQLDIDRKEMEQERSQLQQDEEGMMKQMREMEMSMSRERAELARQRNELQRLHLDIQHALELASRDATLRDRLGPLQRRHQDITNRKGASPSGDARAASGANPSPTTPTSAPQKKESGLFGRLFGKG
jgi:hypothetical protein